ncbi:hypothetical protein IGI04_035762 [Brassica rapa subsp. trilocularis]|uniref:Uncharacterized protein n=1 Tax=Brassica rapa subsp. trilocularis TaxID=1813537 RepID=A0ABQ7LCH1_BRACM|nr:hypothetical protein IGI04_035762 [Brassica rapa subsp. trilocularis]
MVGVGELEIVPHIQEDEFEHEKISEEGCPPSVCGEEKGRLHVTRFPSAGEYRRKRKKKFPPLIGENEESGSDDSDSDSSGSDSSGNGDEGGDNEGSGNEKNDE